MASNASDFGLHVARHTDVAAIQTFINNLARDKQVELSAGKAGLTIKIIALQVQNGLTRQIATETGQVTAAQQTATQRVAETAASKLLPQALQPPETRMKILWIDDHPQNNIGLQYAFQALGMIVVCVDTDAGISTSFATAGRFDLVITDMSRDAVGSRPAESEAGLKTIGIIKADHPGVPVVVYAGSYAAQHANDPLSSPVVAVTNDTKKVFDLAFDIASRKLK